MSTMPARRCSTCAENYPGHVHECPRCGGTTWWVEDDPTEDPELGEMRADLSEEESGLWQYRLRRFRELGFTAPQRIRLADEGADWHQAAGLLAQGCPRELVFDLLSS